MSLALVACGPPLPRSIVPAPAASREAPGTVLRPLIEPALARTAFTRGCDEPILVFDRGFVSGETCADRAAQDGLTIVELGDAWLPRVLREARPEDGTQPHASTFAALAGERFEDVPREVPRERFLELYGIEPTFSVLARRLDASRYACHDAIDDTALREMHGTIVPWGPSIDAQTKRVAAVRYLRAYLERARVGEGLATIDELSARSRFAAAYERYVRSRTPVEAVRAAQAHLRCDGILGRSRDAVFDGTTANALREYHRMQAVFGRTLFDEQAREELVVDRRESDLRAVLRVLRERVADATGLIEDGSAGRSWGTVLGRTLDAPEILASGGQGPASGPAPDLLSPATELAAQALGFTDVDTVRAFFARYPSLERVAIRLPAPPNYHSPDMELRVEIDRGDVWYDYPVEGGRRSLQPVDHRPVITIFARTSGGGEIALVRWSTTIGGWKEEVAPGGTIGWRYKESPAGPRVWRDLVATPAWLPPRTTPDSDLRLGAHARRELLGPGYGSAYGLVMAIHHRAIEEADVFIDEGVRTHGSVSFRSILTGESHGCHRLYNHLSLRLGSFLLAHRRHSVVGDLPASYSRTVALPTGTATLRVRSRGYLFRLDPPVPVNVLVGNVRGRRSTADLGLRARPSAGVD